MFNIGMPELLVVFFVALVVLGPRRLPELARQIGKLTAQLKRSAADVRQAMEQEPPEEIKAEVREQLGQRANGQAKQT